MLFVWRGRFQISPKKRAPRNAKNKRGRGGLDNLPVELGKDYQVEITDMSPNGEGLAKVKGYTIFVGGAKLGDHLTVTITKLDSVCADAKIVQ
jgi:predicted RNA-binding protein with TRAM domain